ANSVYTFTYTAKIADAAALDAIRAELQQAYDSVDQVDGGGYAVTLSNQVDVNDQTHSATTRIEGSVKGMDRPGYGAAFNKSVDPSAVEIAEQLAAGATLGDAIPVTYTLRADLTAFADFTGGPFGVEHNVIMHDALPAEASWSAGEDGFLVLTDQNGDVIRLAPADGLIGNIADAI